MVNKDALRNPVTDFEATFAVARNIAEFTISDSRDRHLFVSLRNKLAEYLLDTVDGNFPRDTEISIEIRQPAWFSGAFAPYIMTAMKMLLMDQDFYGFSDVEVIDYYLDYGWWGVRFLIHSEK